MYSCLSLPLIEHGRMLPSCHISQKSVGHMLQNPGPIQTLTESDLMFQDGRIDYSEFVTMMQKGTMGMGLGRRTMRNSLNISMRNSPGAF